MNEQLIYDRLFSNLQALGLSKIIDILDNYLQTAQKEKLSVIQILDYLFNEERIKKDDQSLIMRTNVAGFPFRKTFDQFDFAFQPTIDLTSINDLKSLRFIHNKENVIFLGPPGVGKTHLAIALGLEVLKHKFSTYYIYCHKLIEQLNKAHYENQLDAKLKKLSSYKLLIIDEIGYLPFDKQGANLFFQLISRRYSNFSTVLTSNRSFSEWGDIFGDNVIASAILDRLLHYSTVISINGPSFRLKERKKVFRPIDLKEVL